MIEIAKYNIKFLPKFRKDLENFSLPEKEFIKGKLQKIIAAEMPANMKKLREYPLGHYRLRIGNYRLFFDVVKSDIIFTACKQRKSLY